ncbi:regulatory protein FlaEY [soil metagenome]
MITFDTSLLLNMYQARQGLAGTTATATTGAKTSTKLPTPPWDYRATVPRAAELTKRALSGTNFINLSATQVDVQGASDDYRKMFALFQGLNTLYGLAGKAVDKTTPAGDLIRISQAFQRGLGEITDFTDTLELDQARIARGEVAESLKGANGVPREKDEYVTGPVHKGLSTDEVAAFQGNVTFDIGIKKINSNQSINIDLSLMGAQPRTLANVVGFINGELSAAGVFTRVSTLKLPNPPNTYKVGTKTVTLPASPDSWALKIKGDSSEALTFSAPSTSRAVYLGQNAGKLPTAAEIKKGKVDETQRQLLKFQTDSNVPGVPQKAGEANWVPDRVFSETLSKEVGAIHATATSADGSVYMLADVTDKTGTQTINGAQDVALMKYDSAGKLLYTRTLGAADTASGFGLAVAADGKVAVTGAIKGQLQGADNGPVNSTDASKTSDSFVSLYNADGEEVWTERRGSRADDEANAVTFGSDGTLYVAGRTKSNMPGATAVGGWDNYLAAYSTLSTGKPRALFTQQFGSSGDDKIGGVAIDGNNVVVAGVENGQAVLRNFAISLTTLTTDKTTSGGVLTTTQTTKVDGVPTGSTSTNLTTGQPDSSSSSTVTVGGSATAGTVRNLGDLQGGGIAGVGFDGGAVVVAGTTHNGALAAGVIGNGYTSSGADVFVAKLAGDLTAQGTDKLNYFGGDGDDNASAMTLSGGKVWIAGSTSSTSLDGKAKVAAKDGYTASLDADTGAVGWSARFTGKDGNVEPTTIAVDTSGVSILDQLGLPKGTLDFKDSQLITAVTSLRAGDEFFIRSSEGSHPTAITILANETLQTLATRVRRAAGFGAKVAVVRDGDYSKLKISPVNDRNTIEVIAGSAGKDALQALGLPEGVARKSGGEADKAKKIYGLKLSNDLSVSSKAAANAAIAQLGDALAKIRQVYGDLKTAATPQTAASKNTGGPVPAYLTAQLANYQAGLNRLTGGG